MKKQLRKRKVKNATHESQSRIFACHLETTAFVDRESRSPIEHRLATNENVNDELKLFILFVLVSTFPSIVAQQQHYLKKQIKIKFKKQNNKQNTYDKKCHKR